MFTLFRCFTGDCSAHDGRPLSYVLLDRYGNITIAVYWGTMMLVSFGLFNVMIACFLQNAQRATRFNDVERRRVLRKERQMVHDKTQQLIHTIVKFVQRRRKDPSPLTLTNLKITRELWQHLLSERKVRQWLDDMGCDDGLRMKLFDKIDVDGSGVLSCIELVHGVVDLLRGKFDNVEVLMRMLRGVHGRLIMLEGALALRRNGTLEL